MEPHTPGAIKHKLCRCRRRGVSNLGKGRISEWHPEGWRAAHRGTRRGRRAFQNHIPGTGSLKPTSSCIKQTPFNPPSRCISLQGIMNSIKTIAMPIRRWQESGGELQAVEYAVCIGSRVLIQKLETAPHKSLL